MSSFVQSFVLKSDGQRVDIVVRTDTRTDIEAFSLVFLDRGRSVSYADIGRILQR